MLRKSMHIQAIPLMVMPWERRKCIWIANSIIIQCLLVYLGSVTILSCFWTPDKVDLDFNKLARIMYLYDYSACGYNLKAAAALSNIRLPNDTYGLNILPIKWKRAIVTVSTRLSKKTRRYVEISIAVHVIWNVLAIIFSCIMRKSKSQRILKITLTVFFYYSVMVIAFDVSMAIVYVADIQQSLTKGMVLRYSGWSVELKLKSYDDFAGWLPIVASILWMRGIVILMWNYYCCKAINFIRRRIKTKEIVRRVGVESYKPIPDPIDDQKEKDTGVLYFRTGENKPVIQNNALRRIFYH